MARVVYTGVTGQSEVRGSLFESKKFWFSQMVPQRSWFIKQVESNGGAVVPLEKQADIKLVDHARKDLPPDTYSYRYVELSIRKGQLEDLKDHAAGPPAGTIRSVGSTTIPPRGSRNSFTREDDQALWDWISIHEKKGGYIQGNEIYKQLEAVNPRHTWQSWRDRWVKTLSSRPRPPRRTEDVSLTPTSSTERRVKDERARTQAVVTNKNKTQQVNFTEDEALVLLDNAEILEVKNDQLHDTWEAWATVNPEHTAREWQDYFEERVLPIYKDMVKKSRKQLVSTVKQSPVSSSDLNRTPRKSRAETSLMDSPLPSRIKKAISPELEPQSPSLLCMQPVKSQSLGGDDRHEDLRSTSSKYDRKDSANRATSSKRKRDSFEEVASSSPLKPDIPTLNKRPRYKGTGEHVTEIPSTPERGPTPIPIKSPSPNGNLNEVIDLEDEDDCLGLPASQSLSEPDRPGQTATSHPDAPPNFDFVLPSPEGGWDDNGDVLAVPPPQLSSTKVQQGQTEDTQQLLTAQTQIPDLSVAEPDGGWNTDPSSPSPTSPSQPHQAPTTATSAAATVPNADNLTKSNSDTTELRAWIQKHLLRGIPSNLVTQALKSTTMEPILAEDVLEHLVQGRGIPNDVAGVWTAQDDQDLRGNDGRRVKRVTEKHGTEAFEERWEFLEDWDGV